MSREVALELEDVADVGASERIDRVVGDESRRRRSYASARRRGRRREPRARRRSTRSTRSKSPASSTITIPGRTADAGMNGSAFLSFPSPSVGAASRAVKRTRDVGRCPDPLDRLEQCRRSLRSPSRTATRRAAYARAEARDQRSPSRRGLPRHSRTERSGASGSRRAGRRRGRRSAVSSSAHRSWSSRRRSADGRSSDLRRRAADDRRFPCRARERACRSVADRRRGFARELPRATVAPRTGGSGGR